MSETVKRMCRQVKQVKAVYTPPADRRKKIHFDQTDRIHRIRDLSDTGRNVVIEVFQVRVLRFFSLQ